MKKYIKKIINGIIGILGGYKAFRFFYTNIVNNVMGQTIVINHNHVSLTFSTPNPLNIYRVKTFSSKEPETLEWIERMPIGSIFWDIGANIGLYSCYAAKKRGCRVFCFEPSVFNLEAFSAQYFSQ